MTIILLETRKGWGNALKYQKKNERKNGNLNDC